MGIKVKLDKGATFESNNLSDSGYDLRALGYRKVSNNHELTELVNLNEGDFIMVKPHETLLIHTGVILQMPEKKDCGDYYKIIEAQLRPRSGSSLKNNKVAILGTIDNTYTNYVGVILNNSGNKPIKIEYGEKIAQVVFNEIIKFKNVEIVEEILDNPERGLNGFGSSGKF